MPRFAACVWADYTSGGPVDNRPRPPGSGKRGLRSPLPNSPVQEIMWKLSMHVTGEGGSPLFSVRIDFNVDLSTRQ
jgi:hypothetical protein